MKRVLRTLLGILILSGGVVFMMKLIRSRHKPATKPPSISAALVEVMPAKLMNQPITINGTGVVVAAHSVKVHPQVSGKVTMVNPLLIQGSILKKDAVLVRIDNRDYRAVVVRRKADVQKAKYELMAEKGRGSVAKKEWSMLANKIKISKFNESLVLRQPQLKMNHAILKSAQSSLQIAKLNVKRTVLKAPFDALVINKYVDVGQVIGPGTVVADLVNVHDFWVRVVVPVNELAWIDLPDNNMPDNNMKDNDMKDNNMKKGPAARVIQILSENKKVFRKGKVISLLGDLEPQGRMARLLIDVPFPMATKGEYPNIPLLLGSYVNVEIQGNTLKNIFQFPEKVMRDNSNVYVMTKENTLSIRKVIVLRREKATVILKGDLHTGDLVIVSRLDTAVQNMKLRLPKTKPSENKYSQKNGNIKGAKK